MRKVVVYNLGCKTNQYESDSVINSLEKKGYEVYDYFTFADSYIINTCAVTNEAERKSRQAISRARKFNDKAKIYIMGCASQKNSEQFKKDNVCYITGVAKKDLLANFEDLKGVDVFDIPKIYEDEITAHSLRTRSYIKIQDGCNNFCSYCIIPYLRGRSRSRKIESIVEEIENNNSKEIVLTGIDINAYGKDIGVTFIDLLVAIAGKTSRLRLGSLEAHIITEDFLKQLKSMPEFCPHFHLSLQSGANNVLKTMNRKYTKEEFYDKIVLIRKYFEDVALTTDLIVGYPTETDEDFEETVEFIKKVKFSDIHCFPYSHREGTKAEKTYKMLDSNLVKERMAVVKEIKKDFQKDFLYSQIGKIQEVLIEEKNNELFYGHSKNYIKIYTNQKLEKNKIVEIKPNCIYNDGLIYKE